MTIAVGFACTDGLVLAVDSEVSNDTVRLDGDKAWMHRFPADAENPALKVGIVGSGDLGFVRYASERIAHELDPDMSKDDVQGAVQGVVHDIYLNHLYPYPDPATRPDIALIIGVLAKDGRRLMTTSLTTVTKVQNYEAVGIGSPLANFLIKRFYSGRVSVAAATFLATQILHHAKNNVQRCGGRSRILVMYHVGANAGFLGDNVIKEYETYTDKFDAAIRPVMFSGPDKSVTVDQFSTLLDALTQELKVLRPFQLAQAEKVSRNILLKAEAGEFTVIRDQLSVALEMARRMANNQAAIHSSPTQSPSVSPSVGSDPTSSPMDLHSPSPSSAEDEDDGR